MRFQTIFFFVITTIAPFCFPENAIARQTDKPSVGAKISNFFKQKLLPGGGESAIPSHVAEGRPAAAEQGSSTEYPMVNQVSLASFQEANEQSREPNRFRFLPGSERIARVFQQPELSGPQGAPAPHSIFEPNIASTTQPSTAPALSTAGSGSRRLTPAPHSPIPTQDPASQTFSDQSLRPAAATPPIAAQQGGPQRSGHYRHGNLSVDYGAEGARQVTASQRVLLLEAENRALIASRNAVHTENQRLKNQAAQNRQAISRAQVQIEKAEKQVAQLKEANASLKRQFSELMQEKEEMAIKSKRMLDSIRSRLDDVLIREISSK